MGGREEGLFGQEVAQRFDDEFVAEPGPGVLLASSIRTKGEEDGTVIMPEVLCP